MHEMLSKRTAIQDVQYVNSPVISTLYYYAVVLTIEFTFLNASIKIR